MPKWIISDCDFRLILSFGRVYNKLFHLSSIDQRIVGANYPDSEEYPGTIVLDVSTS